MIRLFPSVVGVLLALSGTNTYAQDCEAASREVAEDLRGVAIVADQAGAFRRAFEHGRKALASCPDSETPWYALIRAAELGFGQFPVQVSGQSVASAIEAARQAAARQPGSVRILTVLARLEGKVPLARDADSRQPAYAPARVALAAALVEAGEAREALALLKSTPALEATPGTHTIRARALIALGRPRDAVAEARRDRDGSWPDAPEPFLMAAVRRDAEEALGHALLADHRSKEAAVHLRAAAALGSAKAAALLKSR